MKVKQVKASEKLRLLKFHKTAMVVHVDESGRRLVLPKQSPTFMYDETSDVTTAIDEKGMGWQRAGKVDLSKSGFIDRTGSIDKETLDQFEAQFERQVLPDSKLN